MFCCYCDFRRCPAVSPTLGCSNFKNIFPLWALARYTEAYPDDALLSQA